MLLGADVLAGPQLAPAYRAISGEAASSRSRSKPSTSTSTSRSSRRKPWSIASGVSGSGPFSRTEPCERGFIAKAAPLISGPTSSEGKTNRSRTPGGHERLEAATVTWPM